MLGFGQPHPEKQGLSECGPHMTRSRHFRTWRPRPRINSLLYEVLSPLVLESTYSEGPGGWTGVLFVVFGTTLSNQRAITAAITMLFFSSIIMWPLPWMPISASFVHVG